MVLLHLTEVEKSAEGMTDGSLNPGGGQESHSSYWHWCFAGLLYTDIEGLHNCFTTEHMPFFTVTSCVIST